MDSIIISLDGETIATIENPDIGSQEYIIPDWEEDGIFEVELVEFKDGNTSTSQTSAFLFDVKQHIIYYKTDFENEDKNLDFIANGNFQIGTDVALSGNAVHTTHRYSINTNEYLAKN